MFRLATMIGLCIAVSTGAHAAPFGFSKDAPLGALGCNPGGKDSRFYTGDIYTCHVAEAAPFFTELHVNHLPKPGVCHVHGAISINDTPDGTKTKKFFDALARHIQSLEGEPIRSENKIRGEITFPHSSEWLPSIAERARTVRMLWLFLPKERPDRLQRIEIEVSAFGDTTGKIDFTMSFEDWPSCIVPPPPPSARPPVRYTIRELGPDALK